MTCISIEGLVSKYETLVQNRGELSKSKRNSKRGGLLQNRRDGLLQNRRDGLLRNVLQESPSKEELLNLYGTNRLSAKAIGVIYHVSSSTVLRWLRDYNIQICKPGDPGRTRRRNITTCKILKDHAEQLKDDPERLSTAFMQKMVGVKCDDK